MIDPKIQNLNIYRFDEKTYYKDQDTPQKLKHMKKGVPIFVDK